MNIKKEDFPIHMMRDIDETTNLPGSSFFKSEEQSFSTIKGKKDTRIVAKEELQDKNKQSLSSVYRYTPHNKSKE